MPPRFPDLLVARADHVDVARPFPDDDDRIVCDRDQQARSAREPESKAGN
jgi:hypothetical protein